jgi:hypothetical protein
VTNAADVQQALVLERRDTSLTRLINLNDARRRWLVPVARVGQALTVSMAG